MFREHLAASILKVPYVLYFNLLASIFSTMSLSYSLDGLVQLLSPPTSIKITFIVHFRSCLLFKISCNVSVVVMSVRRTALPNLLQHYAQGRSSIVWQCEILLSKIFLKYLYKMQFNLRPCSTFSCKYLLPIWLHKPHEWYRANNLRTTVYLMWHVFLIPPFTWHLLSTP